MSDPLSTAGPHALDAASPAADADDRIEQLLLAGLDHYFAAQYDQAINVWTRVLFLDRSHTRARAYIDRARSALAERQRESDELGQRGVSSRALSEVVDGAQATAAHHVLPVLPVKPARQPRRGLSARGRRGPARMSGLALSMTFALAIAVAGVAAATAWGPLDWRSILALAETPASAVQTPPARAMNLAPPTSG